MPDNSYAAKSYNQLVIQEMEMSDKEQQEIRKYDISIIRPQMQGEDVGLRGLEMSKSRLKAIKKGLLALHTLELMASNIYKFQIGKEPNELNRQLIAAMCNEMTHYQDFQVKLYEYGFKPGMLRWAYWIVGFVFGFGSKLLGTKAILKTGIWVETKAVHHYDQLLNSVEWDGDTRKIIEKDQADEDGHINRWKSLLQAN
jgi:demethoxyubiquinone hydroxylase (CLK1/Coq7/Cat5 family)